MLRSVAESGRDAGIPVSLCGEMGADERFLPLLLGLGLRRLSVHPRAIPRLARCVRALEAGALADLAARACAAASSGEVERLLDEAPRPVPRERESA